MDQEVVTAVAIAIAITMGVMITLGRRTRERAEEAMAEQPAGPKPRTKRQQQIMANLAPPPDIPTIDELVAEEAAATGVNDIPGGEGLDVSLKLRVYWRDEVVRRGCEDGHLEYRIDPGVALDAADTDDVRLVCVRATATGNVDVEPEESMPEEATTETTTAARLELEDDVTPGGS